jgi:LysR family transcriptional regulator of gallate degradation
MDLRQLTYFLRVAERKSISLAAGELNIAQPTLTKSMRLLEEELGSALFYRLPRGVELTDAGQHLLRYAEVIKIQMSEARADLQALRTGDRGTVTIGAGPAWLRRHLPQAVARSIANRPDLKILIVGGFDEALFRKLRRGEVDFVVAETPWSQNADDLEIEVVSSVDLCVVARADHPLSRMKTVTMIELLDYPWVLPVNLTRARQRLDALFMSKNVSPPDPSVETESMAFMLAMVRESDALTYTTSTAVEPPDGQGLVILNVKDLVSERSAAVITRKASWTSPAARVVIDALRTVCSEDPTN